MPDRLSIHEPVLVNTSAALPVRSILGFSSTCLSWIGAARAKIARVAGCGGRASHVVEHRIPHWDSSRTQWRNHRRCDRGGKFSVLSLLPAVLLHISLEADRPALWISGYFLSAIAVALHIGDLLTQSPHFHYAALLLVTLGFGGLTVISVILEVRQKDGAAGSRLAGAMGLFLFAISFVHFGASHPRGKCGRERSHCTMQGCLGATRAITGLRFLPVGYVPEIHSKCIRWRQERCL